MRVSEKIIRNTKFNILGRFWTILVALFLTPYIIGYIGMERFGIWAIVGVLTGYFGLLDFGVRDSFVKFIAEFYAKKDDKTIKQVINVGLVFYSLLGALIIILAFSFIDPLLRLFKIPVNLRGEASFVFLLGVIIFAVSNALVVFGAIQGGLQRMDISNKIAVAITIPNIIGTIFFLKSGYGLPGLMVNNALILGISGTINFIMAFKLLPTLKINPFSLDKKIFKMLFGFGTKRWVTRIEDVVTFQTDKLLISYFLPLGLVGYYQLGYLIASKAREIPSLLISAIVPAASELEAGQKREDIIKLYLRGTKYLLAIAFPIFFFIFTTADLIVFSWLGKNFGHTVLVIQMLAPSFLIMSLFAMGSAIAVGIGKPEFQMKAGGGQAILNLILSVILIIKMGFVGVLLATLISVTLSTTYFGVRLHNYLKLSLIDFGKRLRLGSLVFIPAILSSIIFIFNLGFKNILISNRFYALSFLISEILLFVISYLLILRKVDFFDKEEMQIFRNIFVL
ncbi:MAG: polysaccharide biosynthesis protein [Nitrospirae bacterium]|nr:polysaccharide biosynthesis protein [Nitrospirota bacterium]